MFSLSAALEPLAGAKDTETQPKVMDLPPTAASTIKCSCQMVSAPPDWPHPWPQKESVSELGVLWDSPTCRAGTVMDTYTAATQARTLAHFSRDKAPEALGKPHPLAN